jgi:hypothetical protein
VDGVLDAVFGALPGVGDQAAVHRVDATAIEYSSSPLRIGT